MHISPVHCEKIDQQKTAFKTMRSFFTFMFGQIQLFVGLVKILVGLVGLVDVGFY